jgi:putative Holliday junction resolvase
MRYLGIDFGLATVGLSLADGPLAEPFGQKKYSQVSHLISQVSRLCQEQRIEKIIIGLSAGSLASKTKAFAKLLGQTTQLPVSFQDETLTTQEAKQKLIDAHAPQKKRRRDHAIAATLILQAYLDDQSKA